MDNNCYHCGEVFLKKKKGFKRTSIELSIGKSVPIINFKSILEDCIFNVSESSNDQKFLCQTCASLCLKFNNARSSVADTSRELGLLKKKSSIKRKVVCSTPVNSPTGKRRAVFPTPSKSPVTISSPKTKKGVAAKQSRTFKDKAITYVREAKYYTAFNLLYNKSKSARKALLKLVSKIARDETKDYKNCSTILSENLTINNVSNFSWRNIITSFENNMPMLFSAVKGATTTEKSVHKLSVKSENQHGQFVPGIGLTFCSILHMRFPRKFSFMQELLSVELYRSGCSQKLLTWFNKLGLCLGIRATRNVVDNVCTDYDEKVKKWQERAQIDIGSCIASSSIVDSDDSASAEGLDLFSDITPLPKENKNESGYSLCWDNVQKLSTARHQGEHNQNKMMLWALCFASNNRVNFSHLDNSMAYTTPAIEIPLHHYLPSKNDFDMLRLRMENAVKCIIIKNFDGLEGMTSDKNILRHVYSKESELKSEIVNLGVIQENPASCRGVIEIMKHLHKYVPLTENAEPMPLICNGDQLSVERMVDSKLAMACSENGNDRLDGLIPRPQGFHKRCIILQDSMNMLFNARSISQRGTLYQIKNKFSHRNVKKKISDCTNHVVDFWKFITEGYICLLVCNQLNIEDLKIQLPPNEDKKSFLEKLCKDIVDTVWPKMDLAGIELAGGADILDDTLLYEDSLDDTEEDYLDQEEASDEFDSEDGSPEVMQTLTSDKQHDHVYEYSCAVIWRGLYHICQKDAERENNGLMMMSDWRMDMINFWANNHFKYLILGHRLLAGVNGWLPEKIAHDMVWNSTANLQGKPGHNIALDLVNEFLNNEFKTNLKSAHGQYTEKHTSRCSKLVGTLGKDIENVFQAAVVEKYSGKATSHNEIKKSTVEKFVKTYIPDKLFVEIPGRNHRGFENFQNVLNVKNPHKFRLRLTNYSKALSREEFVRF